MRVYWPLIIVRLEFANNFILKLPHAFTHKVMLKYTKKNETHSGLLETTSKANWRRASNLAECEKRSEKDKRRTWNANEYSRFFTFIRNSLELFVSPTCVYPLLYQIVQRIFLLLTDQSLIDIYLCNSDMRLTKKKEIWHDILRFENERPNEMRPMYFRRHSGVFWTPLDLSAARIFLPSPSRRIAFKISRKSKRIYRLLHSVRSLFESNVVKTVRRSSRSLDRVLPERLL